MLSKTKFLRMMEPRYNYSRRKTPAKFIAFMGVGFIWLFACVWFSSQTVRFNYEINELIKKRDSLTRQNRILELRLQTMTSVEKVGKVARKKYGFAPPQKGQVRVIKNEAGFFGKIIRAIKRMFSREKKV